MCLFCEEIIIIFNLIINRLDKMFEKKNDYSMNKKWDLIINFKNYSVTFLI